MAKTRMFSAGNSALPDRPGVGTVPRGRQTGFTLLELIVVLAIAGLLLAVAPPLISRAIPGVELKSAARQLAAGLNFARSHAVRTRQEAVLTLDIEQKTYTVSGRQRNYAIPQGIDVALVTAESETRGEQVGSIRFFPSGGATGGRVTLSVEPRHYDIDVDWLTGRVRILD